MTPHRIANIDLDIWERQFVSTTINLVRGIEIAPWECVDSADTADVVLVNVDTRRGAAFLRRHAEAAPTARPLVVPCVSRDAGDTPAGELGLGRPIVYAELIALLRQLDAELRDTRSRRQSASPLAAQSPVPETPAPHLLTPVLTEPAGSDEYLTETGTNTGAGAEAVVATEADPPVDVEAEATARSRVEAGTEADLEADPEADREADREADLKADPEADPEAGLEADLKADLEADLAVAAMSASAAEIEGDLATDIEAAAMAEVEVAADVEVAAGLEAESVNAIGSQVEADSDTDRLAGTPDPTASTGRYLAACARPAKRFFEDTRFAGVLKQALGKSYVTEIRHAIWPTVTIYPMFHMYTAAADPLDQIQMYRASALQFVSRRIDLETVADAWGGADSQPVWKLFYAAYMYGSEGRLLPHGDRNDRLHLVAVPDLDQVPHDEEHRRLAECMAKHAFNLTKIVEKTQVSIGTVIDFCNACEAIGLLERISATGRPGTLVALREPVQTKVESELPRRTPAARAQQSITAWLERLLHTFR